jgi:cytoskeletal protein CcmA (bactofilin family)
MATSASRRIRRGLILLVLLVLAVPAVALAQQRLLAGKFRSGREVVVPRGETVSGDLYASGGSVRIDGSVEGDLVATGGQIEVTGDVGGDLIAGAGSVDISGRVEGDVRAGAGQVTVSGSVGEDLLVGAGQLSISSAGTVGEDLVFGTGRTTLDGRVEGDVLGSTGNYVRHGTVGGSEDVTISRRGRAAPSAGDRVLDAIRRFVSLLVIGALLLWLAPWSIEGPAATLRRRPWVSLGFGALAIVGAFVAVFAIILAMILLLFLFGLLSLGDLAALTVFTGVGGLVLLFFLLYVVLAFLAPLAVASVIGRLVFGGDARGQRWGALALGVLVVVVLSSLPVVGGWFGFVIVLFGLGAIVVTIGTLRTRTEPPPAPPPTPPTPSPAA